MVCIVSPELIPQLKNLLEIFKGEGEESMRLGIGIFQELFPKNSYFLYNWKLGDLNEISFITISEIILFN